MKRSFNIGAALGGLKLKVRKLFKKMFILFWIGACFISWEQNNYCLDWSLPWATIKNFGVIIIEVSSLGNLASEQLQAAREHLTGFESD